MLNCDRLNESQNYVNKANTLQSRAVVKTKRKRKENDVKQQKQGRIHGHQLRTGGQERKCAFSHISTRAHQRTNGPTDRRTDGRTKPLVELCVRN